MKTAQIRTILPWLGPPLLFLGYLLPWYSQFVDISGFEITTRYNLAVIPLLAAFAQLGILFYTSYNKTQLRNTPLIMLSLGLTSFLVLVVIGIKAMNLSSQANSVLNTLSFGLLDEVISTSIGFGYYIAVLGSAVMVTNGVLDFMSAKKGFQITPPANPFESLHPQSYQRATSFVPPVPAAPNFSRPAAQATLIVVGSGVRKISSAPVTLGRSPHNGIVIKSDGSVSGIHARIVSQDGFFYIEDLNSTNGTRVNGRSVRQLYRLNSKDEIRLGTRTYIKFMQG